MFDGRIYRAALAPLLLVLVIVGFSLTARPGPLTSTLAPDAFDGARAFANLQMLAKRYPDRRAGSTGDQQLAGYLAATVAQAPGGAGKGFQISIRRVQAHTLDGERTLETVIAQRPGSTGESPIVILAHRDAAQPGSAAELSGTAVLVELARVFAQSETRRTIVLVSTSGGSGGEAGAADFAAQASSPLDAAIVLGDLAGTRAHKPFVLPFSAAAGVAPDRLSRTLARAISQEVGIDPGEPGLGVQLAHLALPLSPGEQAPLDAAGVPTVLVQVSGERGPSAREPISRLRLQSFGRAVLSAVYAFDEGPDVGHALDARLSLGHKMLPGWAVRLLALALLLPALLVCVDALARLRRRHEPIGRWLLWVASCASPLLACALFAILLGRLSIVAAPAAQPPAASLAGDGSALGALAATMLVLALALAAWPALARRLSLPPRPSADGASLAVMLVLLCVGLLTWLVNPFACLLLVPAAHLWLIAGRRRAMRLALLALSALPFALLALAYARDLGLGPLGLAESVVLMLAGGQLGLLAAVLWSLALGCALALALLADPTAAEQGPSDARRVAITTRGPLSYAGPGSLGGTESALRR